MSANKYPNKFKYNVIELYCDGASAYQIAKEHNMSDQTVVKWVRSFVENGLFDENDVSLERKTELEILREKAKIIISSTVSNQQKYSNKFKYNIIELYCNGASASEIAKEHSMADVNVLRWVRSFVKNEIFDDNEMIPKEKVALERLRKKAELRLSALPNHGKVYTNEFKYNIIESYANGASAYQIAIEFSISEITIAKWVRSFVKNGLFDENDVSLERKTELEILRDKARINLSSMRCTGKKYSDEFKYNIIQLYCDGLSSNQIAKKYNISEATVINWERKFVEDGLFDKTDVNPERKAELEKLRNKAKVDYLLKNQNGESSDESLQWVLKFDKELEEWRVLAEEWLSTTQIRNKSTSMAALSKFFKAYLFGAKITKFPQEFLSTGYEVPNIVEICYGRFNSNNLYEFKKTIEFIDWILLEKYSVEDDWGTILVPPEFSNPIKKYLPENHYTAKRGESNKNILPYQYIKELRSLLCPPSAKNFKDLNFSMEVINSNISCDHWFVVDKTLIDKNDSDCVWRKRKTAMQIQNKKGSKKEIYEMWSPVLPIALLTELLLPLRNYQVRMLDSGEMDTFKYIQPTKTMPGEWIENDGSLAKGTEDNPFQKGAIRKFYDSVAKRDMAGFFINTNKTADINKEEDQKGYEVPWEYCEVLYWLSKLRDWQQKYNPVSDSTPFTDLKRKHLGEVKDKKLLSQMGSATFLFRNPTVIGEKNLPLTYSGFRSMWNKLLTHFEHNLHTSPSTSPEEKLIKFMKNNQTSYYPLHSLRVSLITAYALYGGVPMPILSKCIVGHARLVMTLYYIKSGVTYVTDIMNKAESKILENTQNSLKQFIENAKLKDLKDSVVVNDTIAYQTAIYAQGTASIIMGDKGICLKGNFSCDDGGIYINNDGVATYGPVPGYPTHNCIRCRWFLTGPAFLPSLTHHFNSIGYKMSKTGDRVLRFQNEIEKLDDLKYKCELNGEVFTAYSELLKAENLHQEAIQENDKLANDYNATLRLIDKCFAILKNENQNENIQLVPLGTMDDVKKTITLADNKLELLQIFCNGAEIYPETDMTETAILERSQIIDLTLTENGKEPVMFSLTIQEQLKCGNQFMRLLAIRTGSFKNAMPYALGRKRLDEIGLLNEFVEILKPINLSNLISTTE